MSRNFTTTLPDLPETHETPTGVQIDSIQMWPIEKVLPYDNNPRRIPEDAIEAVATSIRQYGWQQPIVVDAEGVIVVGHTRRLAALRLGLTTVPVHVTSLSEEKVKEYRLVDNRTSELSTWNHNSLVMELREFEEGLLEQYFPELDLDAALVADVAPPSEKELEWAEERATRVKEAAEESLHTTQVECPSCFGVFAVRTRSLPGMDSNAVKDLMNGRGE